MELALGERHPADMRREAAELVSRADRLRCLGAAEEVLDLFHPGAAAKGL